MPSFQELQITLPDGYPAYARYWAASPARGAVLYHHGIQSHGGWYETSPRRLTEAGFAVLQVDRRGSGRNQTDRGHAESAEQLIADAQTGREELLRRSGCRQFHVVGVSWGGKLAVAAYVVDPANVRSLSLVTPGLFPIVNVSKAERTEIGFSMLYEPTRLYDIPLNDPELFTADPRWQEFFRRDPLTLRQCTAGFYLASRRMDRIVKRLPASPPVPIHLFVAGEEQIIDNAATTSFFHQLHFPGSRITAYDTARHSLEFEADREAYFKDLTRFIAEIESAQS
jgi:alpha-beta hydrolase superfamily lysophospholipase